MIWRAFGKPRRMTTLTPLHGREGPFFLPWSDLRTPGFRQVAPSRTLGEAVTIAHLDGALAANPTIPRGGNMADVLTPEQRHLCMTRVRYKDTKPELRLRKALWAAGLRYRLSYRLPGHPDLAFPGKQLAVFVDGCFWHGCPLHATFPKTNKQFWDKKLRQNKDRDTWVNEKLASLGWRVVRIWEHEISGDVAPIVERIKSELNRKHN